MTAIAAAACPKCGYLRRQTDTAPAWECPACGIAIAKYQALHAPLHEPAAVAAIVPLETPKEIAQGLVPETTQRMAIIMAALPPALISLQLFAALLFPLAGVNRAWARDAIMLIGCELLLAHAGALTSLFAGASGVFRFIGLAFLMSLYAVFLYAFAQITQSWWIAANVGVLLLVRLATILHDGGQGAGERFARGFLTLAVFMVVLLFPLMGIKKFPAFGFTPEVYAQLVPSLSRFKGLINDGSGLAKVVVLAALLYLLSAAMELVRLRMVTRETSAPGLLVADDSLALRADGPELTAAHIGNYAGGLLTIAMSMVAFAPLFVGIFWRAPAEFFIGLALLYFGVKILRMGLHELLSRTVFHARKGEIEMREGPIWGEPVGQHVRGDLAAALTVVEGFNKNSRPQISYAVTLKVGKGPVEIATGFPDRSLAEGLRKLLLAYAEGIERAEVKKTVRDDADIRGLLGEDVETALGE